MSLNFKKYSDEGNLFIRQLSKELGYPGDELKSGRILKTVLHGIRDHISHHESIQLLAQLPMFLKAIYVDGWSTKEQKRTKHINDFLEDIIELDGFNSEIDFPNYEKAANAITIVFNVLRKYVSEGEIEDIQAVLPKEIKFLLNKPILL